MLVGRGPTASLLMGNWPKLPVSYQVEKVHILTWQRSLGVDSIRGHLLKRVGTALDEECSKLCSQEKSNVGLLRQTSVSYFADFKWMDYIQELKAKAPICLWFFLG